MTNVPVQLGGKTQAWVNANQSHLLLERQHLYILDGANAGRYYIGDGVTPLSGLTLYGGSGSYTFQNGLTESGGNVELGGTLNQNTFIDGNFNLDFGTNTPLNNFNVTTDTGITNTVNDGVNQSQVTQDSTHLNVSAEVKLQAKQANRILATDTNQDIQTLNTTTYPNLTELSYVKGVTSAIQTQINNKLNTSEKSTSANQVVITDASNVLTSLSLSANQSIRRNAGNTAFEAYTPSSGMPYQPAISNTYRTTPFVGTPGTTNGIVGQIMFTPYYVGAAHVITELALEITSSVAGTSIRLGLYRAGSDGLPDVLIEQSGVIPCDTGGLKTFTLTSPVNLTDQLYYLAYSMSASTVTARSVSVIFVDNNYFAGTGTTRSARTRVIVYGSMPNPAGATLSTAFCFLTCAKVQ